MKEYEIWSVALIAIYDALTLLLFTAVAYETWVRPRRPRLSVYPHRAWWDWEMVDFVIENTGPTLHNVTVRSDPDDLGWGIGRDGRQAKVKTGDEFAHSISVIGSGELHRFFWCKLDADLSELDSFLNKPFKVIVTFDNPMPLWWRLFRPSSSLEFQFNKPSIAGYLSGVRTKLDIHQIARELRDIKTRLDGLQKQ